MNLEGNLPGNWEFKQSSIVNGQSIFLGFGRHKTFPKKA